MAQQETKEKNGEHSLVDWGLKKSVDTLSTMYQMFSMYLRARMNDKMNIFLNPRKYVRVSEMV